MKCRKCGQECPPRAKFCIECGAALAQTCAGCGTELPSTAKFCPECARPTGLAREETRALPQPNVPRHLAERILDSRAALEGERKQVTVLFADMKGSMEMLAERDPEEARSILDPVLQRMMDAVHHFDGTVNQVMGDGIMALFGAPLAHEDHAVRACYAALRLQESIRRYTDEVRHRHGAEVLIRIGINSGEVVVRSIGSDLRMDYTAVGQTTGLAARMEQLALPGTSRLTAATVALAEGFVDVKPLGTIPVKGVPEPVEAFELVGAVDARTRLQARRARGLARFVGRESEMDELQRAASQAQGSRGQIVAVVGEAGVGKSRLFYEFTRSHHVQGWRVMEASSVSYGKATAFLPLIDLLRAYFHIDARDDQRAIRAKVTGTLLTLDESLRDALPAMLWLLDALPADSPFVGLDAPQRRRTTLEALKRLMLRESQMQPLMVVFEDLHWIDSETQAFLDSLVASIPAAAVLLAVNFRPEYQHGWGTRTYYRQLRIDPLGASGAEQLLADMLGTDPSVAALAPLLALRTQGNPLYIEESVRGLVESGALVGARAAYRLVRPLDTLVMPASVQAILAARIDRLRAEDKRLLQAAAVVGMDVPYVILREIAELPEDDLRGGIARLLSAEFLYEARLFPDLAYTFHHALTHDVAYAGVLSERRRALHGAIVDAAERLLDDDGITRYVEQLAHHALNADVVPKALRYLRLAGAKAAARSANREALAFLEQALKLLAGQQRTREALSEELDVRMILGPVLRAMKGENSTEAEAMYRKMDELVDELGDEPRRYPVHWGLSRIAFAKARFTEARERGEKLLAVARQGDDSGQLLEAHHLLWPPLIGLGRAREALEHIERGLALYDRKQHFGLVSYVGHDAGACCQFMHGVTHWILGYPDRAMSAMTLAERLCEELGHPLTTVICLWYGALLHQQLGNAEACRLRARRVVAMCEQHNIGEWHDTAQIIEAAVPGEPTVVLARIDELERLTREHAASAWRRTYCQVTLSGIYLERGHAERAAALLASIVEPDRTGLLAPEVERLEAEACLRRALPSPEQAERHFRRAIEIARERDANSFELRAALGLARLLQGRDRRGEARRALAEVFSKFQEGSGSADLRSAKALLDSLSA